MINECLKAGPAFYQLAFCGSVEVEKVPELIRDFETVVAAYSKELEKRGTKYFAGVFSRSSKLYELKLTLCFLRL